MSAEANKALVRQVYETIDRTKMTGIRDYLADNYRGHFSGSPEVDANGLVQFGAGFFAAMPDIRHEIEDLVAEGDKVAVRLRISGTHTGEMMGIPPSGKRVSFSSSNMLHIADGKVVEQWAEFDIPGMLQQVGAMPAPATA